jgi:hypothetical protein
VSVAPLRQDDKSVRGVILLMEEIDSDGREAKTT